jgi:hypothetical protein
MTAEEFQRKSRLIDDYCAEIGRDPATIARSTQIIIDPQENPATTHQIIQSFIAASATHLVLAPRAQHENIARWLNDEIIEPVREAVGA